ncbi:MAG TPA: CPBP family intramembrane glutamic endopeptidase [Polyangia bacterium]|jgi:membrane protease YdiL (CAAX protease family)
MIAARAPLAPSRVASGGRPAWRAVGVAVLVVTAAVVAERVLSAPMCARFGRWGWVVIATAVLGLAALGCRALRRAAPRRALPASVWGGALVLALCLGVFQSLAAAALPPARLPRSPWLLLYLTLLVPVAEELAFRGVVHDALRSHLRAPVATLLSAALFAAAHPLGPQALFAFGLGLVLAVAYDRAGTLAVPIAGHAAYNLAAYAAAVGLGL